MRWVPCVYPHIISTILHESVRLDVDLVILGRHKHGPLYRALMDSTDKAHPLIAKRQIEHRDARMAMALHGKNTHYAMHEIMPCHWFDELFKHTTSADNDYRLLYYRDADKFEVDVVIENTGGQLVGIELKASATVKQHDLRGLKKHASLAGDQFTAGVLLYDGYETMALGGNIWAAPISTLWGS